MLPSRQNQRMRANGPRSASFMASIHERYSGLADPVSATDMPADRSPAATTISASGLNFTILTRLHGSLTVQYPARVGTLQIKRPVCAGSALSGICHRTDRAING